MSVYIKEEADYFIKSVESMLHQTIKPDEIIIVEDGPLTDDLNKVIDNYVSSFSNTFTIIKNEKNLGLGLSLQKGIIASRNEFIARMDTDDISRNDRCEKQLAILDSGDVDVVGGNISEFIDSIDNCVGHRVVPTDHRSICEYLKKRCPFNHMTVMYKKSAVLKAGNYLDLPYNEDYYLWVRMYVSGATFANINEDLVDVRTSEDFYKRRGGKQYFKSEKMVQKYMREKRVISFPRYLYNVLIRFCAEVMLPNGVRRLLFAKFLRKKEIKHE